MGGGGGGLASAPLADEPNLKTLRDEKRDGLDGAEDDESGRNEDEPDGGGLRLELIMCLGD